MRDKQLDVLFIFLSLCIVCHCFFDLLQINEMIIKYVKMAVVIIKKELQFPHKKTLGFIRRN